MLFFVGKLDSWEWDSGARDMSPVPKTIGKKFGSVPHVSEELFKVSDVKKYTTISQLVIYIII